MVFRIVIITALSVYGSINALCQTTLNPDISAVGDFRLFSHNDETRSGQKKEINLTSPGFELNIGGYLNPYARADVVVAWHGEHNAEIEEMYATIMRGLPLGANLRVGKYLLEFGRLNPVHPHAYSFMKRPLPHATLFGDEGLADMAVRAGFLLPTGTAYTELMAGLLKGDILAGHVHHHDGETVEHEELEEDEERDIGCFVRLTSSLAVSETAELAVGASAVNAVHAIHEHETSIGHLEYDQLRCWLAGGDIKYKQRPDRNTSLQIEAEGIIRISEQPDNSDDLTSYGGYGYVDYRFRQKYNLGGIFEWVRVEELHEVEATETDELHRNDRWRVGLFAGWAPIEETSLLRLTGHWTEPAESDSFWEVTLQFVVSLGPHKPHNF